MNALGESVRPPFNSVVDMKSAPLDWANAFRTAARSPLESGAPDGLATLAAYLRTQPGTCGLRHCSCFSSPTSVVSVITW